MDWFPGFSPRPVSRLPCLALCFLPSPYPGLFAENRHVMFSVLSVLWQFDSLVLVSAMLSLWLTAFLCKSDDWYLCICESYIAFFELVQPLGWQEENRMNKTEKKD